MVFKEKHKYIFRRGPQPDQRVPPSPRGLLPRRGHAGADDTPHTPLRRPAQTEVKAVVCEEVMIHPRPA